jgi:hypothetical protein
LSVGANAPSGQATLDRGTPGQFDPITIRIEDHRNARHVSQRDRRKAFAHALASQAGVKEVDLGDLQGRSKVVCPWAILA